MRCEFSKNFYIFLSGVIRATFLGLSGFKATESKVMELWQIKKFHPKKTSLPPKIQFLPSFYIPLTPYTQNQL